MTKLSEENLGRHAMELQALFQRLLEEEGIAESVIDRYVAFCKTADATRLKIFQRPVTAEMRLRLNYECQCFCTFSACKAAPKFIKKRRWLFQVPNSPLIERFHGAIAAMLIQACVKMGASDLREIILVEVNPELRFGFGERLDPLDRLEEYRKVSAKEFGNEQMQFAKRIGMSLDAPHYPLLEVIGLPLAIALLRFTYAVMEEYFSEIK